MKYILLGEIYVDGKLDTQFHFDGTDNFSYIEFKVLDDKGWSNTEEALKYLCWCIHNAWSFHHEKYEIGFIRNPAKKQELISRCKYEVNCGDGIFANIYGYGETEVLALINCLDNQKMLETKYSEKEDDVE